MAIVNYFDNIIERLFKILESEFKKQLKIYRTDRPDIHKNQISLVEGASANEHTWAPDIVVDRFPVNLILRHIWQKDEKKKELLNKDYHRLKTAILANRSDSTTDWFNGLVTDSDAIEIMEDEEGNKKFWQRTCHFSCLIAYDHTE